MEVERQFIGYHDASIIRLCPLLPTGSSTVLMVLQPLGFTAVLAVNVPSGVSSHGLTAATRKTKNIQTLFFHRWPPLGDYAGAYSNYSKKEDILGKLTAR